MSRGWRCFLGFWLLGWGLFALSPAPAGAHPLDEAMQFSTLTLAEDRITVEIEILVGPLLVGRIDDAVDINGDGQFSAAEQEAWGQQLTRHVSLRVDEHAIPLHLIHVQVPTFRALINGEECVFVRYQASLEPATDPPDSTHRVTYVNSYLKGLSFYATSVLIHDSVDMDVWGWRDDGSVYGFNYKLTRTSSTPSSVPAPTGTPALTPSRTSAVPPTRPASFPSTLTSTPPPAAIAGPARPSPSPSPAAPGGDGSSASARPQMRDRPLEDLLRTSNPSMGFVALALGLAMVIGGLHALTPGHGKAIVAAYLVGARGTWRHATLLGSVVTLTHTISVIVLGLLMLLATQIILPERVIPWLEVLSGLLIVGLGISLFWQRWRDPTGHGHRHLPSPVPTLAGTGWGEMLDGQKVNVAVLGHAPALTDLVLHGCQCLAATQDPDTPAINLLGLCCTSQAQRQELVVTTGLVDVVVLDRGNEYPALMATAQRYDVPIALVDVPAAAADPQAAAHTILDAATEHFDQRAADQSHVGLSWRNLISLGVSGGLVPCPDALAILLLAMSLNRIAFGLSIILAFSLGLAAVLIAIGLVTVTGRSLLDRFAAPYQTLRVGRLARWISPASALVVVILGLIMVVQVMANNL